MKTRPRRAAAVFDGRSSLTVHGRVPFVRSEPQNSLHPTLPNAAWLATIGNDKRVSRQSAGPATPERSAPRADFRYCDFSLLIEIADDAVCDTQGYPNFVGDLGLKGDFNVIQVFPNLRYRLSA